MRHILKSDMIKIRENPFINVIYRKLWIFQKEATPILT